MQAVKMHILNLAKDGDLPARSNLELCQRLCHWWRVNLLLHHSTVSSALFVCTSGEDLAPLFAEG